MTRLLGLVGKDLRHSFSPAYFQEKFEREGLADISYELFPLSHIEEVVSLRQLPNLQGFNVTIPYKSAILPYLDEIDAEAATIGAVNTVVVHAGKWKGFNTDIIGFAATLAPFLPFRHAKALVLGTGGASKAVIYVLQKAGFAITQVSREAGEGRLTYDDLTPDVVRLHQLVVNTTPLGTSPQVNDKPNIPYEGITANHVLIDLVYNPAETAFMKAGVAQGATAVNGYKMLVEQAEAAWRLWPANS